MNGKCPAGYHSIGTHDDGTPFCSGDDSVPNADGSCVAQRPILFQGRCVDKLPVLAGSTTGAGGGFIQMIPSVPANKDGTCPTGSHNVGSSGNAGTPGTGSINCISDKPATPTNTGGTTNMPVTCENGKHADASGNCVSDFLPLPGGKCVTGTHPMTHAGTVNCFPDDRPLDTDLNCVTGRIFDLKVNKCVLINPPTPPNLPSRVNPLPGGGCPSGYRLSPLIGDCVKDTPATATYHLPPGEIFKSKLPDGSCPAGYRAFQDFTLNKESCRINSQQKLPDGSCPPGTILADVSTEDNCVKPPVLPGSKTGAGGGFIQMIPSVPANKDGTCPTGSHNVGSSGSAGQPGTGSINCIADKPSTPTQTGNTGGTTGTTTNTGTPTGTTKSTGGTSTTTTTPMKTGTGGTTTTGTGTTTNTGKPTTPSTTTTKSLTPPPTSTATPNSIVNNKNVIRGASGGGGSGTARYCSSTANQ